MASTTLNIQWINFHLFIGFAQDGDPFYVFIHLFGVKLAPPDSTSLFTLLTLLEYGICLSVGGADIRTVRRFLTRPEAEIKSLKVYA